MPKYYCSHQLEVVPDLMTLKGYFVIGRVLTVHHTVNSFLCNEASYIEITLFDPFSGPVKEEDYS